MSNSGVDRCSSSRLVHGRRRRYRNITWPDPYGQIRRTRDEICDFKGNADRKRSLIRRFHLQGFLYILRESHRTRTVFRKVGGFVYIVSLLISMEGCLAVPPKHPWTTGRVRLDLDSVQQCCLFFLLKLSFSSWNPVYHSSDTQYINCGHALRTRECSSVREWSECDTSKLCSIQFHSPFLSLGTLAKSVRCNQTTRMFHQWHSSDI